MKYYIVDAFTDCPFGGNPAGVVLQGVDPFPDDGLMTRIAAELRFSETAFVRRLSPTEYHQVPDVETLDTLHPDMEAVAALTEKHKAVSFHCFALPTQTINHSSNQTITAHVRDFAPLYGIPEESATGTANASLTHYLSSHGVIPATGDFSFLQGEAMGRPSVVATRVAADGTIYVGGSAAVVANGEINAVII